VLQGVALVSLLLVGVIVFGDFLFPKAQDHPLKFICIPFVVWVAFELQPRAAALAILAFRLSRSEAQCTRRAEPRFPMNHCWSCKFSSM